MVIYDKQQQLQICTEDTPYTDTRLLDRLASKHSELESAQFKTSKFNAWVSTVLFPARHITGHFGDFPGNQLHWY